MPTKNKVVRLPRRSTGARRLVDLPDPFPMHLGGELQGAEIAYESWGELSPERDNGILLFTGLSPSAHACSSPEDPINGWWEYMIGPGHPIDTRKYFVVCVNSLGSCFGSTGPSSLDPATGEPYHTRFPVLTVEDIARSGRHLARRLGIERLHSVVGASLGGMSALAYAAMFPGEVDRLVSISAALHAAPFAIAVRSLQREIIRSDPAWQQGNYEPGEGPVSGMLMARKLGLLSYRSMDEWRHRFGRDVAPGTDFEENPFGIHFEVESYLDYNSRKFIGGFDANSYLYLSRAMDLFDLANHGRSMNNAVSRLGTKDNLVMGVESDYLFPPFQQQEMADRMRQAGRKVRYHCLPCQHGHDSFLVDSDQFGPVVADFFS